MSKSNKGKNYASGENNLSWMSRVPLELEKIKKAQISVESNYWKPRRIHDHATSKYGFSHNPFSEKRRTGTIEEWTAAYKRFCNKKRNIYGKKVNRKNLLDANYNEEKFGKALTNNKTKLN